jgi:aryl-alcohol dehydrogenase-like predicted oxidoreductase
MNTDFLHTTLGRTELKVHRLGLSGTYWPGKRAIKAAIDNGINYYFFFGIDKQMLSVLKETMGSNREKFVLATGSGNMIISSQNLKKGLEKRLRQLKTDYIDIFHYIGIYKEKHFPRKIEDELLELKNSGKIRFVAISCHHRKLIGRLASEGELDVFMLRYNAAHRGAETDIFPYLAKYNPGVISYTATRWGYLLRRPKGYTKDGRLPTAGDCYRFVLSNPNVHVVLNAPRNEKQLIENIKELEKGPLSEEEMSFMKSFGDTVYNQKKWFW